MDSEITHESYQANDERIELLFSQRREHIVDNFINECRDAVGHSDGVGHIGLHDENQIRDALGYTDPCSDIT